MQQLTQLKKNSENVYKAITQQIDKWWTEDFLGSSKKVNEEFTIRFGTTFKTLKVTELTPNKKVVWTCIDTLIDIPELPNNTEWKGTEIVWNLDNNATNTKISLTHIGLTPKVKCYNICEKGWVSFLDSLKLFVETGKGSPFQNKQENI
ncbi:SRPBCC domain-containing protein [Mariniflexile gromovii]|uniref:SRPBCC family protein n=1 Tax=Mariniflexile gromovii TaxID=362523 RepID=UPI00293D61DA|nr:SRPBCC domain-containing protein [Mariniflexile gromovii]